MHSSKKKTNQN